MPQIRRVLRACTRRDGAAPPDLRPRPQGPPDREGHPVPRHQGPGIGAPKNYCLQCALAILDKAADDLQAPRDQLS